MTHTAEWGEGRRGPEQVATNSAPANVCCDPVSAALPSTCGTALAAASDFRLKNPKPPTSSCSASPLSLLSSPPNLQPEHIKTSATPTGAHQDAINHPPPSVFPPQAVKIQSNDYNNFNNIPTQPSTQINHPVDLNFSTTASPSNRYSSIQTANITGSDFPVFTTDPQSTWPPQSASPSLSATNDLSLSENNNPQDFVLFDSPPPNRPAQLRQQRRPSSTNQSTRRLSQHSPAVRNQRVSQIIQATGHQQPSSPVNANLFDHQFYASSAPSSTVSLNQQSRPNRPPVPLFHQSTGSVPTAKMMNAAGSCQKAFSNENNHLHNTDVDLDEFTAFEGGHTAFSSPAMPTNFDFPNGSASSSMGTVSPNDLFVTDNFMSAPNSSALTALTSPSINESPDVDSYDVSPQFQTGDFGMPPPGRNWFSLFPEGEENVDQQQQPQNLSPEQPSEDLERPTSGTTRRKSGNTSPSTSARHSSVSGVNSRKRDKPLPPIVVEDPHDTVAMKRARNTLAARKSRERKAQRFEDLEDKIAKLEAERDHWKRIALSQGAQQN